MAALDDRVKALKSPRWFPNAGLALPKLQFVHAPRFFLLGALF